VVGKQVKFKEKKLIFDGQRSHPTKIIKKVFVILIMGLFHYLKGRTEVIALSDHPL
jgi:hypothetical protein